MFRGLKGRRHGGIHVDEEVLLDLELLIPLKDFGLDPLCKLSAKHCVNHISQPLSGQLGYLFTVGQIGHDIWATDRVLHHGFYRNPFILGAVDVFEVITFQS